MELSVFLKRHIYGGDASGPYAGVRGLFEGVVFQKWRWPCLHCPSKGVAVDKQANDDVVHLCCFRKADGLADQAFNARP